MNVSRVPDLHGNTTLRKQSFSRRLLDTSTPPFVYPLYTFRFVEDEPSLSFMKYRFPFS
jgi:hypothetical protein